MVIRSKGSIWIEGDQIVAEIEKLKKDYEHIINSSYFESEDWERGQ